MKLKLQPSNVRAAVTANSYNTDDNTIEVVFATEFKAQRMTWDGTPYIEVLECTPQAVRLGRANSGLNLIDTHDATSVKTIYGVVVRCWVENNQCKAQIRLSKRPDAQGVVGDIIDGIISNVSVRYGIYGATQIESENEVLTVRITDWEPEEITICSIPVDYTAGIRSSDKEKFYELNISKSNNQMEEETVPAAPPAAPVVPPAPTPTPVPAPAPSAPDAGTQERSRIMTITSRVRAANINDNAFLDSLISNGRTIEEAATEIFDRLTRSQAPIIGANGNPVFAPQDQTNKVRSAMENALMHRANPNVPLKEGVDFRGMTLMDMARECVELSGIKTRGMSRRLIAETALNASRSIGMNSTSDFPLILGNTVNRVLRAEYDIQMPTYTKWASRGVARDFRTMTRVGLGEVGDFKEVKEGAEYEYTTLGEGGESYKVVKYGQIIAITWETLINDDMDAFSRIPRKIVAAATRKQSDIVYAILTGNPKMADNKNLFSADHNNLAQGAAIGIDSIGAMRTDMRKQKGLDGKEFLNLTPKFLITGAANEQAALQYTSTAYTANTPGNINVWSGMVEPIIEARIPDNSWFFAASPSAIDTIEYAFLEGEDELFTEQRQGFEVDGLEIKARMVFGAKAIDFRGLSKNPGL